MDKVGIGTSWNLIVSKIISDNHVKRGNNGDIEYYRLFEDQLTEVSETLLSGTLTVKINPGLKTVSDTTLILNGSYSIRKSSKVKFAYLLSAAV